MTDSASNSFSKADIESAHLAFSVWQGTQQETVDEYVMRKRKSNALYSTEDYRIARERTPRACQSCFERRLTV